MALRNLAMDFEPAKKQTRKPKIKVISNKGKKVHAKVSSKTSLILSTLCVFSMLIILNYRYNLISEKNLTVQRLEIREDEVGALLTNSEIDYKKMVDISQVEAYAKQQLGMQEPEKNQMVYVGSNYKKQVVMGNNNGLLGNIISQIKQKINEIF